MNSPAPRGIPLRPAYSAAARPRASDHLIRAIVAKGRSFLGDGEAPHVARQLWRDDEATQLILRGATAPATTAAPGWAKELATTAVADLIVGLGPASAASELFRRAISLSFGSAASLFVPGIVASASGIGFVREAEPFPVRQLLFTGPTLNPHKLPVSCALTHEMFTTPNAEALVRLAMTESLAAALDERLFDDVAGSDIRPPGLRFGVVGLVPASDGGEQAMGTDLAALASAVAPVGGSQIAFVAAPGEAAKIALRSTGPFPYPVLPSNGLAAKTVLVVALNALVVAVDPESSFTVTKEAIYHAEDTAPQPIAPPGGPISAPVRSLWQTDCIALRLMLDISWGVRAPSGIAWVGGVTW